MSNRRLPGQDLDLDVLSGVPRSALDQLDALIEGPKGISDYIAEADPLSGALKRDLSVGAEVQRLLDEHRSGMAGIVDRLSASGGLASNAFERLGHAFPKGVMDHIAGAGAAHRALEELTAPGSSFAEIQRQIDEQQAAIHALRSPPHEEFADRLLVDPLPPIDFPVENPLHETNDRLASIEEQFERAQEIAANAASIATGLQQAALQFLEKFEAAARDNDRSAGRAIWIGVVAVIIAVAMPVVQVVHTEFWRAPADAAASQAALSELKAEVEALRASQEVMADRIATALDQRDAQAADVLRDIRDLLAKPVQHDSSTKQ